MAPVQPENQQSGSAAAAPPLNNQQAQAPQQQDEMQEIALQPMASQPMDPERPHQDSQLGLRGGDRGGFCFCIPRPLPCDFCII
ncbi:uncharacterized protein JN550_005854 [Neoarthrinium moseri]|uniref:uncharacterized protein n=1 Tax=Neoarthrinium moseri TaxID=1658444 RepID=UPI001FDE75F9|nr:uncharacterized protein JN550_005854 [Neoarthrinium moseri]KAI1869224.1 hypothetical protein JN550_005854 [Neoarthrinium moseri]